MEIQINEILIEPKLWQLFYHFEHDKYLMGEIFSSKIHQQVNNSFFVNDLVLQEEKFFQNIDLIKNIFTKNLLKTKYFEVFAKIIIYLQEIKLIIENSSEQKPLLFQSKLFQIEFIEQFLIYLEKDDSVRNTNRLDTIIEIHKFFLEKFKGNIFMINSIVLFSYLTLLDNDFNYEQFSEILDYDVLIFILLLFFFKVLNYHFRIKYTFTFPFNLSIPLFELYESKENDSYYNLHIIEVILACNKINIKSFLNFEITLFFSHITYEQFLEEFVENYMHFKLFHFISYLNYNELKLLGRVHNLKEFLIFYYIFKKNLKANFEFDLSVCTFLKNSTKSLFKFGKRFFASKIPKLNIKKFYELIKSLAQGNVSDEDFISMFYSKLRNFNFIKIIHSFNLLSVENNFEKIQGISQYFINQQFYKIENVVLNDKSYRFYKITLNFTDINIKQIQYLISFLSEKNKTNSSEIYYLQITYFDIYDISIFINSSDLYFEIIHLIFLLILYHQNNNFKNDKNNSIINEENKHEKELFDYLTNNVLIFKNILKFNNNDDMKTTLDILNEILLKRRVMFINQSIKQANDCSDSRYYYLIKKSSLFIVIDYDLQKLSNEGNILIHGMEIYFQPYINDYNNIVSIFNEFKDVKQLLIKLLSGKSSNYMKQVLNYIKVKVYFKFFDNILHVSNQNPYLQVLINDLITNFLQLIDNELLLNLIKINNPNLKVKFSIFQLMLSMIVSKRFPNIKLSLENILVDSFTVFFLRSFILSLDEIGLNYENITKIEINPTNKTSIYRNKTDFRLDNVLESLAFKIPIDTLSFKDPNFTVNKENYHEFIMEREDIKNIKFNLMDIKTCDDIDIVVNMIFQLLFERTHNIHNKIFITISELSIEFTSICIDLISKKILAKISNNDDNTTILPQLIICFIVDKNFIDNKDNISNIEDLLKINYIQLNFTIKILFKSDITNKQIKEKVKSKFAFKSELTHTHQSFRLFNVNKTSYQMIGKTYLKKFIHKENIKSFLVFVGILKLKYPRIYNEKILRLIWKNSIKENKLEICF